MQLPVRQKIGQTTLEVEKIRRDGGTQPRVKIDLELAREYGEAQREEGIAAFDPVVVFWDGTDFWLADGFHRVIGARLIGLTYVRADVREGTRRDAVLFSAGANPRPGIQRRTNEDKRRAVLTLLNDEEWGKWSNNEIARRCVVSLDLVNRLRPTSLNESLSETRTYTTKHGTVATMNTGKIGHTPSAASRHSSPTHGHGHDGHDGSEPTQPDHQPPAAAPARPSWQPKVAQPDLKPFAPAALAASGTGATVPVAYAFHPGSSSVPLTGVAIRPLDNGTGHAPGQPATAQGSQAGQALPPTSNERSGSPSDQIHAAGHQTGPDLSLDDLLNRYDADTRQRAENDTPDDLETLHTQRREMVQLIAALRTELAACRGVTE